MAENLSRDDLKQLYAAYSLYNNWHQMSPAQKSKAVISLGIQGYKFTSGNDFSKEFLIKPNGANQGLTYGGAFSLFSSGVNVYSLSKNWDQLNTLQRITGGATTGINIAQTAKNFNLLGYGTKGSAVKGGTDILEAGWSSTPSAGVGAVSAPTGTQIPTGYTAIPSGVEGQVTAIPAGNVSTAGGAIRPGTPMAAWGKPSYAGYAGAAMEGVNAINTLRGPGSNQEKAYAVEKNVALGAADVYTAGGASAAYALLNSVPVGRKLTTAVDKVLSRVDPLSNAVGMFGGDKDKWKTEGDRLAKLKESGAYVPDSMLENMPTRGRSTDELVGIENAKASQGQYSNAKFAASRDVADLQAKDIWGYAAFIEHDPDWMKKTEAERLKTAQLALDSGAVKEHHGTIDIDWEKMQAPGAQAEINGEVGGSQMQAGLADMAKNNPYAAGALMAHSAFSPGYKEGNGKHGFDSLKGHLEDNFLLPDGSQSRFSSQSDKINTAHNLDYYAGLAGVSLTEMLAADKHPSINKAGQQLGNAMLEGVGSGAPFTPENFSKVRDNFRATYSKAGISSKADAYRLANVLYAGNRVNDTDLFRMHQVADMTFGDNGYDIASKLFPSKTRGLEVAAEESDVSSPTMRSNVLQFQTKEQLAEKNRLRYGGGSGAI